MDLNKLPVITSINLPSGTAVLMRTPMNVPIVDGEVKNAFRITRALATVRYLLAREAKVILVGHIGDGSESTAPIAALLEKYLPTVKHVSALENEEAQKAVSRLKNGEVLVLDNVRRDPREVENSEEFARDLASLADVFVNDAFADSHRSHASIVGIPRFLPTYVGFNFIHEYEALLSMQKPLHPSLFMIGGSKFSTKLPLVEKMIEEYDHVFVGGALAHDIFAARGYELGQSLTSTTDLRTHDLINNPKLLVPIDVLVTSQEGQRIASPDQVLVHEKIVDMGPATVAMLQDYVSKANTILWNGPFGVYELGFDVYTKEVAKAVAASKSRSVVGGGDTVASIEAMGLEEKFTFLSTAGGAMLTFLETGTLAGIEAILEGRS